jgi:hypothetical protein
LWTREERAGEVVLPEYVGIYGLTEHRDAGTIERFLFILRGRLVEVAGIFG